MFQLRVLGGAPAPSGGAPPHAWPHLASRSRSRGGLACNRDVPTHVPTAPPQSGGGKDPPLGRAKRRGHLLGRAAREGGPKAGRGGPPPAFGPPEAGGAGHGNAGATLAHGGRRWRAAICGRPRRRAAACRGLSQLRPRGAARGPLGVGVRRNVALVKLVNTTDLKSVSFTGLSVQVR
jgi:hypothetical protein